MTIKEKKALHKAWATKIDEPERAKFEAVQSANPTVQMAFVPSIRAQAIRSGAAAICKHFYIDSNPDDSIMFPDEQHSKTVKQTVRANIAAYNNVCIAEKAESVEDYKKIYSALKKRFEEYFALASEDALIAFYGDEYKQFVKEYEESHKRTETETETETE